MRLQLLHLVIVTSCLNGVLSQHVPANLYNCSVTRTATNGGFHRNMTTVVKITVENVSVTLMSCRVVLTDHLPAGMYVDQYEIARQKPFGGPQIYVSSEMDIEQPEYLSPPDTELVSTGRQSHSGSLLESVVVLPLHLRYHRPTTQDGYVTVTLPSPEVSLACSELVAGVECRPDTEVSRTADLMPHVKCHSTPIDCHMSGLMRFTLPVAKKDWSLSVSVITVLVSIASTAFLACTIMRTKHSTNISLKNKNT